ncbi:MAG TPA: glycosyl transferase family 1 [Lachnospiraceae bacterium]|nr:glycosyl transferase family 1 [Lachnospiraceae bacterium]
MNILVITQLYPQPDDVGDNKPTRTVEYFAKEWVKSGHKVIVAHCPSKFPFLFYLIPPQIKNKLAGATSNIFPPLSSRKKLVREEFGIKVYRFPMIKALPGNGYSQQAMRSQAQEICESLNKEDFIPDLVVGHFANPSAELTAIIAKHYNAKSSIVFHHDCTDANIEKYRLREIVVRIGAIGARSVIEAKEVQEKLHLNTIPFICYSGAPNDAVKAAKLVCNKQDFSEGIRHIYVGSLIKRKHLDVVIKAFLNTAGEKDTLTVVGGGPEEEPLRKLASELKAGERIIFTGRIPRDEVLKLMGEAQVFTLISHGETFGMVYIEAMLQGCLTIASKGGGFDGLIQDGVNGFICEPGDQINLEKVYKRIAAMTTEERNRIGQAAIDIAIHYSEQEVAERYLKDIMNNQR